MSQLSIAAFTSSLPPGAFFGEGNKLRPGHGPAVGQGCGELELGTAAASLGERAGSPEVALGGMGLGVGSQGWHCT